MSHIAEHLGRFEATDPIDAQRMELAVNVGRLLIPHAIAAHRLMGCSGNSAAVEVVQHYMATGWPREPMSLSDWWRPVRKIAGASSRDFEPIADMLCDHGYIVELPSPNRTGRPARWFRANRSFSVSPFFLETKI